MNGPARWIATIAIALVAYFGVKSLRQSATDRLPTEAEVTEKVDGMRNAASAANPNLSKSDALREYANKQSAEKLSKQDATNQTQTATSMFFGFYFVNTRARFDYCANRGVDITPFVSAFQKKYAGQYALATSNAKSFNFDPQTIISVGGHELAKMAEQDMKDIAASVQIPESETCAWFNANAVEVANLIVLPPQVARSLNARNAVHE